MKMHTRIVLAALIGAGFSSSALACNSESYIGSVCLVAYTFCPRGTADASGQLLPIAQNTALFSLLGTTYGGDGRVTFALPDLRGRVPIGVGQGSGLSAISEGQVGGAESVTLTVAQLAPHSHSAQAQASSGNGNTDNPAGAVAAKLPRSNIYSTGAAGVAMGATAVTVGTTGGAQPIPVRDPSLGMRYCIVLEGIFPSRN